MLEEVYNVTNKSSIFNIWITGVQNITLPTSSERVVTRLWLLICIVCGNHSKSTELFIRWNDLPPYFNLSVYFELGIPRKLYSVYEQTGISYYFTFTYAYKHIV